MDAEEPPTRPAVPLGVLVIGGLVALLVGFVVLQWVLGLVIGLLRLAVLAAIVIALVAAGIGLLGGSGRR